MRTTVLVAVVAGVWTSPAISQTVAVEHLPVDEVMERFEALIPSLTDQYAAVEEELEELGESEPDWSTSGLSASAAVRLGGGNIQEHVIGEWEVGGNGVYTEGDRPLTIPEGWYAYSVREYDGPVEYNYYHRLVGLSADIVIHTFGSMPTIGNAECHGSEGIQLLSSDRWQDWSGEAALVAFGGVRATRDDPRTYCTLYRQSEDGSFRQLAYSTDGRPYIAANRDAQSLVVTPRNEATTRIFAIESRSVTEN